VTIIAADGLASEALSKAVFVLGVQRGLALVDTQPGVDAVVIDAHGVLHASSGLLHGTHGTHSTHGTPAVRETCQ
jgi:thiamine biosynthesis lipoprotein